MFAFQVDQVSSALAYDRNVSPFVTLSTLCKTLDRILRLRNKGI